MKIHFYGAARRVTGSNYLIETANDERFILDCGMFQGSKAEEAMNEHPLPYRPEELAFAILSHAHIDHSGRLPKLVKDGFRGSIYSTQATSDLAQLMLEDSAGIQESDAEWENKHLQRRGQPLIEPLYDKEDVTDTIKLLRPQAYGQIIQITPHIRLRFRDAGHILGSAIVELWIEEGGKTSKLVFSGDLGMRDHLLIRDPEYVEDADYLLLESTYGNSVHDNYQNSLKQLMHVIEDITGKGGTVVIPSFAVGRTQELIYEMNKYYEYEHPGEKYPVPIYIDSPLAVRATRVFMKNTEIMDDEAQRLIRGGDNVFEFANLHYTKTVEESMRLNKDRTPKVIISASGMATAGRVRHHLKHTLWNPKNGVIFVGYQGEGTLGRIIQDGAKKVKILGEWVACKAKVYDMGGFSAHADQPSLLDWLGGFKKLPHKIFLVHGEDREMLPFARTIKERFGIEAETPREGSAAILESGKAETLDFIPTELEEKKTLEEDFYAIQALMSEWEDKEVALENLSPENLAALQNTLNKLRMGLMDLNLLTGR